MKRLALPALALALLAGCSSSGGPSAVDGSLDFVQATPPANELPGARNLPTAAVGAAEDSAPGDAAPGRGAKLDKQQCAAAVKASNGLLDKRVLRLFAKPDLRQIEHLTPEDTFNCSAKEGPDFGGLAALWRDITGAQAIDKFTADGWTREDPKTGPPDWATKGLQHTDGSLNLEPGDQFVVTFHLARGGRHFWAELTQDGMRAGLDDAA